MPHQVEEMRANAGAMPDAADASSSSSSYSSDDDAADAAQMADAKAADAAQMAHAKAADALEAAAEKAREDIRAHNEADPEYMGGRPSCYPQVWPDLEIQDRMGPVTERIVAMLHDDYRALTKQDPVTEKVVQGWGVGFDARAP